MKCSALFLAIVSCALVLPQAVRAENRAFVVGINGYTTTKEWEPLDTPISDAKAVADVFQAAKFSVVRAIDATQADFEKRWEEFLTSLQPDDLAIFYFAGHGFQIDGANYLVLKDTAGPSAGELALLQTSRNFYQLMEQLQARRPGKTVYILDSCRVTAVGGKTASARLGQLRGIALGEEIYGTFVLYSAGPGQFALDSLDSGVGNERHSPYVRRLLPLLKTKDLGLLDIAVRIRVQVEGDTKSMRPPQTPAYIDGIKGGQYHWDRVTPADKAPAPDATITSSTVIRLGGYATWDENCQPRPAPRIVTLARPRYGRIFTRFESFTAGGAHFGPPACVGTPQKGIAVYYAIDAAYTHATSVDSVRLTVKHWSVAPTTEVTEAYSIDLERKHSRRIAGR